MTPGLEGRPANATAARPWSGPGLQRSAAQHRPCSQQHRAELQPADERALLRAPPARGAVDQPTGDGERLRIRRRQRLLPRLPSSRAGQTGRREAGALPEPAGTPARGTLIRISKIMRQHQPKILLTSLQTKISRKQISNQRYALVRPYWLQAPATGYAPLKASQPQVPMLLSSSN
jgi:hypothetical protein